MDIGSWILDSDIWSENLNLQGQYQIQVGNSFVAFVDMVKTGLGSEQGFGSEKVFAQELKFDQELQLQDLFLRRKIFGEQLCIHLKLQ
jgi:hypothetical protein